MFVELHKVPASPFLQLVEIPLNDITLPSFVDDDIQQTVGNALLKSK